jgi:hypothetical protein
LIHGNRIVPGKTTHARSKPGGSIVHLMYTLCYVSDRPDSIVSETYFNGYIQYSFTVVSKVEYLEFHALLRQWKYGKYFNCGLLGC